jgi:hypothetical protein
MVDVENEMPAGEYALYVAVTEDGIEAQGPNGEPVHNQVFRWLYPDEAGVPVVNELGMQVFEVPLDLNPDWVFDNLRATTWVQQVPGGPVQNSATMFLTEGTVGIGDDVADDITEPEDTPQLVTGLQGAHPNPFNPMTTVYFTVATPQHVTLAVFDMSGHRVAELANGVFAAGEHPVQWNGKDTSGRDVSSGTYLIYMESEDRIDTSKMMLVR